MASLQCANFELIKADLTYRRALPIIRHPVSTSCYRGTGRPAERPVASRHDRCQHSPPPGSSSTMSILLSRAADDRPGSPAPCAAGNHWMDEQPSLPNPRTRCWLGRSRSARAARCQQGSAHRRVGRCPRQIAQMPLRLRDSRRRAVSSRRRQGSGTGVRLSGVAAI